MIGGVVLHHRTAAAACACLTVDAAAECGRTARRRHSRWFSAQPLSKFKGFYNNRFFSNMASTIVGYHCLTENNFPTVSLDLVYSHSFLQCRRLQLEIRKGRIIFWMCPTLHSGALAVPRQPKNSGTTTALKTVIEI